MLTDPYSREPPAEKSPPAFSAGQEEATDNLRSVLMEAAGTFLLPPWVQRMAAI